MPRTAIELQNSPCSRPLATGLKPGAPYGSRCGTTAFFPSWARVCKPHGQEAETFLPATSQADESLPTIAKNFMIDRRPRPPACRLSSSEKRRANARRRARPAIRNAPPHPGLAQRSTRRSHAEARSAHDAGRTRCGGSTSTSPVREEGMRSGACGAGPCSSTAPRDPAHDRRNARRAERSLTIEGSPGMAMNRCGRRHQQRWLPMRLCTSGQICSASRCGRRTRGSTRDREWGMSGNVCRCGSTPGIVAAIRGRDQTFEFARTNDAAKAIGSRAHRRGGTTSIDLMEGRRPSISRTSRLKCVPLARSSGSTRRADRRMAPMSEVARTHHPRDSRHLAGHLLLSASPQIRERAVRRRQPDAAERAAATSRDDVSRSATSGIRADERQNRWPKTAGHAVIGGRVVIARIRPGIRGGLRGIRLAVSRFAGPDRRASSRRDDFHLLPAHAALAHALEKGVSLITSLFIPDAPHGALGPY